MSNVKELEGRINAQDAKLDAIIAALGGGKGAAAEPVHVPALTSAGSPWRIGTLPYKRNMGPGTAEPEDVQLAQKRAKAKAKFTYTQDGEIRCTVNPGVPEYRSSGSPKKVSAVMATGQSKFVDKEGHEFTMVVTVYYVDPVAKAAMQQAGQPVDAEEKV